MVIGRFPEQTLVINANNVVDNVVDNVADNVADNVVDNVVDNRLNKILNLIAENKQVSAAQIAKLLNTTSRTVQRDIEKLKKRNRLIRVGPEKGGHWEITN